MRITALLLALASPALFQSLVLCDTSSRVPAEMKPAWAERIKTAETQGTQDLGADQRMPLHLRAFLVGQQRKIELGNAVATLGDVSTRVEQTSMQRVQPSIVDRP